MFLSLHYDLPVFHSLWKTIKNMFGFGCNILARPERNLLKAEYFGLNMSRVYLKIWKPHVCTLEATACSLLHIIKVKWHQPQPV